MAVFLRLNGSGFDLLRHLSLQNTGDTGDKNRKVRVDAGLPKVERRGQSGDKAGTKRGQYQYVKEIHSFIPTKPRFSLPQGPGPPGLSCADVVGNERGTAFPWRLLPACWRCLVDIFSGGHLTDLGWKASDFCRATGLHHNTPSAWRNQGVQVPRWVPYHLG